MYQTNLLSMNYLQSSCINNFIQYIIYIFYSTNQERNLICSCFNLCANLSSLEIFRYEPGRWSTTYDSPLLSLMYLLNSGDLVNNIGPIIVSAILFRSFDFSFNVIICQHLNRKFKINTIQNQKILSSFDISNSSLIND